MIEPITQERGGQEAALPPLPEAGQVVNVRGSTWAVADVRQRASLVVPPMRAPLG